MQNLSAKPYRNKDWLSSIGFIIFGVHWLVKELNILGFKATRQKSNNTIYISPFSTESFLDYIGKCPVDCYQYKWDYN